MPDLKSIKFPGSEAVYEVVDAAARSRLSTLEGSMGTLVDDTLSESGKAADAKAAGDAIYAIGSGIYVTGNTLVMDF